MQRPDGSDPSSPPDRQETEAVTFKPQEPRYVVVSNTTPLIALGEVGLLHVLRQLYGSIAIPPAVFEEYQRGIIAHPQRPNLLDTPWVVVRSAKEFVDVPASLDAGEREAIALAVFVHADRLLLDERHARAIAKRLNLTVTGSVGVLLVAKSEGIVSAVRPHLDLMVAQGRYMSPDLYQRVLDEAHE